MRSGKFRNLLHSLLRSRVDHSLPHRHGVHSAVDLLADDFLAILAHHARTRLTKRLKSGADHFDEMGAVKLAVVDEVYLGEAFPIMENLRNPAL